MQWFDCLFFLLFLQFFVLAITSFLQLWVVKPLQIEFLKFLFPSMLVTLGQSIKTMKMKQNSHFNQPENTLGFNWTFTPTFTYLYLFKIGILWINQKDS